MSFMPAPPKRLCAALEGFSLHAATRVRASDRKALYRLCHYGARGALANSRLRELPDGRFSYEMKRPSPSGKTHLVLTATELPAKLTPLIPPPWSNLTRFHGVFAPGSALRPLVVPRVEEPRRQPQKSPPPDISGFRGRTRFLLSHDDGAKLIVADSTRYDQLGAGAGESTLTLYEPRGEAIVEVSGVDLSGDTYFTLDMQNVCDTAPTVTGVSWQALFYRVLDGGGGSELRSNFTIDYDDCLGKTTISELEFVYVPNPLPDFLVDAGVSQLWAIELRRNLYPNTGVDWYLDHDDGARVFLDNTLVVGGSHWAAPMIHANATRDVFQFPAFGGGGAR